MVGRIEESHIQHGMIGHFSFGEDMSGLVGVRIGL